MFALSSFDIFDGDIFDIETNVIPWNGLFENFVVHFNRFTLSDDTDWGKADIDTGFKNTSSETNACKSCAKGRWSLASGLDGSSGTPCIGCSTGKYNDEVGSDESSDCKPCVAGKYNDVEGSDKDATHPLYPAPL